MLTVGPVFGAVLDSAKRLPCPVILTKVRTQSHAALHPVTLDPDFRQDDGVVVAARPTLTATAPATAPLPLFTLRYRMMR
jgi:hypothetical protein